MIEIRNKAGRAIRRSRNLRGVLDYARDVSGVQRRTRSGSRARGWR